MTEETRGVNEAQCEKPKTNDLSSTNVKGKVLVLSLYVADREAPNPLADCFACWRAAEHKAHSDSTPLDTPDTRFGVKKDALQPKLP